MKLLTIHAENFRLHADSQVEFPPRGVTGLIGSNEAGKSALLEAASWALYGAEATRGTMDGLRWHGAPARHTAAVTLRFEIGGKTYRIERGENGAKLYDEATGTVLADGTSAVNEYTPGLIGMTWKEFVASYMVLQKDVARIAAMGPTERQTFIRQVMGVGKIDAALGDCRKRKNELAQERGGLEAGLGEREPLENALEAAKESHAEAQDKAEVRKSEHAGAYDTHEAARKALDRSAEVKKIHEAHAAQATQAANSLEAAALEVERIEKRLTEVAGARQRLEEAEPRLSRIPDLRAERDQLREARAAKGEAETLRKREAELVEEIAVLREEMGLARAEIARFDPEELKAADAHAGDCATRLASLQSQRGEERARAKAEAEAHEKDADRHQRRLEAIQDAGAEGDCPTCTRRLGEQFLVVVEALVSQRMSALAEAEAARARAADLEEPSDEEMETADARAAADHQLHELRELQRNAKIARKILDEDARKLKAAEQRLGSVRDRRAALPSTEFDADRLTEVELLLEDLEELEREVAPDRALVSQEKDLRTRLEDRSAMKARAERELKDAEKGIEDAGFDEAQHAKLESAAERARQAMEDARVAHARAEEAESAARERVNAARKALEDYDQKAERLTAVVENHRTHEQTATRLADFREAVAATIRPEMEELMSGFVHLLTEGRHEAVTLTDDFEAVLHESGVPSEVVSGGTEDIAALAMRLALSQMIAERAGHPLSLLILDEPFGSLDETRRASVLRLIRRLRGTFEQVLVISHVAETRDMVDHAVELEYDEGAGRTRVVSTPTLAEEVA